MSEPWKGVIQLIGEPRALKPRAKGITMVIDKGLGLCALQDLIEVCGEYIDLIKLTFGTSALYDKNLLKKKKSRKN